MAQSYKTCPICGTPAHRNATVCSTCGAGLSDVAPAGEKQKTPPTGAKPVYDHRYGENDLFEGQFSRRSDIYFIGIVLTVAILVCGGSILLIGPQIIQRVAPGSPLDILVTNTPVPTRGGANAPLTPAVTNTPRPTLQLATVTPAPPTETTTPTQGPCMQTVASGDTLFGLAGRCGHRDLGIIDVIVATNSMTSPESLQIGQQIEIPWPTATVDPNSIPTQAPTAEEVAAVRLDGSTLAPAERALITSRVIGTATLQPGVMWHTVQANENILTIAFSYGANIEILSQLNPQITFSQCDFGSASGGPNCIVSVYVGQQVRVPAPTATPTIPPTPSGSETPTPTATPTFNAPSLTQPGDRSIFRQNQLVTLRWVATATLGRNQVYRVHVEDVTMGIQYTADTQELFLIVPEAWQGQELAMRHDYQWRVSVIDKDRPDDPIFETPTRMFTWEALGLRPTETPTP